MMNLRLESAAQSPSRVMEESGGDLVLKGEGKLKAPEIGLYRQEEPMAALRRAWATWLVYVERTHDQGLVNVEKEVHLLRLTMKRLRGYMRLVRPVVRESAYREGNQILRDAARRLAGRRDYVVALRTIEGLERKNTEGSARRALGSARRAIEESGMDAGDDVSGEEDGKRLGNGSREEALDVLRDSLRRFSLLEPQATEWAVLERGLCDTYGRARKRYCQWLKSGEEELAHDCRKHAKYLMFQLDLLRPISPKKIDRKRRMLSKMEGRLGKLNDLWTLERRMDEQVQRGALPEEEREAAGKILKVAAKDMGRSLRKAGKRFVRKRPRKFVGGLGKDWRRWRRG